MIRNAALLVATTFMVGGAFAQVPPAESTYRLQPEDVIAVSIYRVPEVNAIVPVGPDGNVAFPYLPSMRVAGKTLKELEHELTLLYAERLKLVDPIVSVSIREYRRMIATVNGFVGRPGSVPVRPGDRILDVLAAAGGTSTDGRADLRRAVLIKRGSSERIPIDLNAMLLKNDSSQNYLIEDGDMLIVPEERTNRVVVNGRVRNSGPVIYREGMRLSEVLAGAGEIERRSRFSRVQVFRRLPGENNRILAIECNMVAFNTGKDPRQDIELQPGDFIYVPDSGNIDFGVINSITNFLFYMDRLGIDLPLISR